MISFVVWKKDFQIQTSLDIHGMTVSLQDVDCCVVSKECVCDVFPSVN